MANVIETIASDRRISLGREEYLRPMSFGAGWSKIRLGIRFAVNGRADILSSASSGSQLGEFFNCYLQMGFAADTTGFLSDRSNGYMGARFGGSPDNHPNWTYQAAQANSSAYIMGGTTELSPIVKLNNTFTNQGRLSTGGSIYAAANTTPAHALFITWSKNNNVYTLVDFWGPQSIGAVQAGLTVAQFYQYMDNEFGVGSVSNISRVASNTAYTTTLNPVLSYVSIFWPRSTPSLEITHIAVTKFF